MIRCRINHSTPAAPSLNTDLRITCNEDESLKLQADGQLVGAALKLQLDVSPTSTPTASWTCSCSEMMLYYANLEIQRHIL